MITFDIKTSFKFINILEINGGKMEIRKIAIRSSKSEELIDITSEIRQFIIDSNIEDGKLTLYVPHTTAAVTINENADPTVRDDIIFALHKLIPRMKEFRHLEGNSDAHIKSSLIGCSQDVIISKGNLLLGTWQGIFFCEFDGPRNRSIILTIN